MFQRGNHAGWGAGVSKAHASSRGPRCSDSPHPAGRWKPRETNDLEPEDERG